MRSSFWALSTAASEKAHFSQALPALRLPTPTRRPADSCTAPQGLAAGGVDVAVQLGALAHQAQAGAEQVAQPPPLLGVGIGGREVAALEQSGDGLGVLAVALGLGAVHGFHGPGVAQREGDAGVA